jgi:hypothetical protein
MDVGAVRGFSGDAGPEDDGPCACVLPEDEIMGRAASVGEEEPTL